MHFTRYVFTSTLSPSAILPMAPQCGIYVLEFANGEEYVGQTIHLLHRVTQHRRRHPDIVAVRFAEVARDDLDEVERRLITQRRDDGISLRNRVLLTQPTGSSPLDSVVDKEVQLEWLSADLSATRNEYGDRLQLARRRERSRQQFEELRTHPDYESVLASLALHVDAVIPWPHSTEGRSWTVSALPSTNRSKVHHRLAALSINNVEMLFLGEDLVDGEWEPFTVLNTAVIKSPSPEVVAWLPEVHTGYRSAGPVTAFALSGYPLCDLFAEEQIVRAARELAMSQLRKGRGMFARFHNDALTDAIYARIAADEGTD